MAAVLADTHALLWMLDESLPRRSLRAANALAEALADRDLHVSVGTFLDLRYLVDSQRQPLATLEEARRIVEGDAFTVVPVDLATIDAMAAVPRDQVPDPFDRMITATAVHLDLPVVTADDAIQAAIPERVVW